VGDGAAPLHCGSDTVTKREQLGLSQRTAPGHRRGPVRRALALNWQCASLSELPETATRARKAALGQGQRALNFPGEFRSTRIMMGRARPARARGGSPGARARPRLVTILA
jgi:hypothetical protein